MSKERMTMNATIGVKEPLPGVTYPPADRLRAYVEAGALPEQALAEALRASFARHAVRTAIATAERDISYAELDDVTNRFASALRRLGVAPLERVLFQAGNSPEVIFTFVGCLKAGVIPVCTLTAHREHEISYLGRHSDARVHMVQGNDAKFDLPAFALKMKEQIPTLEHIVAIGGDERPGVLRFADLIAAEDSAAAAEQTAALRYDPYQVAVFQLSGGSTGTPKIISRFANDYLLNALLTAEILAYEPADVIFNPMPMIHNACMICCWIPALLSGASFAIAADLTPESWEALFRAKPPTFIGTIRALMPRLEMLVQRYPEALASVRAFWCPDAARLVRKQYGIRAHGMFGMTEGMNMYVRSSDPLEAQDWTVGNPMSAYDEVRLIEPGGDREVAVGEIGELQARGPYTLHGYFNAPDRNCEAFTADGFYKTGDLLVRREIEGELYYAFAGRLKDIVNRGMEKVCCEELEHALCTHDAVLDAAVVGMTDEVLGERVCAYLVLRVGAAAPGVPELGAYLQNYGLAKFKWPERIELIDALPLTKAGKLDKTALRTAIDEKLVRERSG
jgi:non-ribosomal peptide synthetase component E (peptide arylation enzyme)